METGPVSWPSRSICYCDCYVLVTVTRELWLIEMPSGIEILSGI